MFRRLGIDERKGKVCASVGCDDRAATYSFEASNVLSYYCSECQRSIEYGLHVARSRAGKSNILVIEKLK